MPHTVTNYREVNNIETANDSCVHGHTTKYEWGRISGTEAP